MRRGEVAAAKPCLEFMDEVYSQSITVDFPTPSPRPAPQHGCPALGAEHTHGDLTLAIRQDQMRQALVSFEANLDRRLGTEFTRDGLADGALLDVSGG